jgi:hypothetical protein
MPLGILIIMKHHSPFSLTYNKFVKRIDTYFKYVQGEYHMQKTQIKKSADLYELVEQKVWNREPEPPTIAGLALFLGFNSIEFDAYEGSGKFAPFIKRARLFVAAAYEKKLHQQPSGAIFALKSMGWNEKAENTSFIDEAKTIGIKIIEAGPQPVSNEKEIIL